MLQPPEHPIAAVTHPDPYPYYADLVANRPIYRDETARMWIASSAASVTAVLTSDLCRVRLPTEQVPRTLLGSSAGEVFRHLVRMTDGRGHGPMREAVSSALQAIDAKQIAAESDTAARLLIDELAPQTHPSHLTDFAFLLPVYVVASLLGISHEQLPQVAVWASEFVRCLAPTGSPEQIEQGKRAAGHLLETVHALLDMPEAMPGLASSLARESRRVGYADREAIAANSVGFLSQTYEATAGLIGNVLLTLARHQDIYEQVLAEPDRLRLVIHEVLRYDSPVQNTRRYLSSGGVVAGEEMHEGDAVLVVLAAANRDPAANPDPERFDIFRKSRVLFTFGAGAHGCPGESIAEMIARAGVARLVATGANLPYLTATMRYRPSVNVRVPLFEGEG
ncbi:MAG: cytochrome P450 [Ktedonobacterales bacterium]